MNPQTPNQNVIQYFKIPCMYFTNIDAASVVPALLTITTADHITLQLGTGEKIMDCQLSDIRRVTDLGNDLIFHLNDGKRMTINFVISEKKINKLKKQLGPNIAGAVMGGALGVAGVLPQPGILMNLDASVDATDDYIAADEQIAYPLLKYFQSRGIKTQRVSTQSILLAVILPSTAYIIFLVYSMFKYESLGIFENSAVGAAVGVIIVVFPLAIIMASSYRR